MKHLILFLLAIMVFVGGAYASSNEDKNDSASESAATEEVKELKEKIANKVGQLQKKNQKAVSGMVTTIGSSSLVVLQNNGKKTTVTLDKELTKLYTITGTAKRERDIEELEEGDFIIVAGPQTGDEVIANVIYIDEQYIVFAGRVIATNATDFSLELVTPEQETYTIDVETNTKRLLIDSKTLSSEVIGFSKIKEGDVAHVVAKKGSDKDAQQNKFSAARIVILPQEYFIK